MANRFLLLMILIIAGCSKSPPQKDDTLGPLYAIPAEMKAWTMFNPGSFWNYRNEKTGNIDTTFYKYGPYFRETPCINCPVYQYMWFFVNSPVFVKFKLTGAADSNAKLNVTTRDRWNFNVLTYRTLIHPDASSNDSSYYQSYKCLGLFSNFLLNGHSFSNVIATRLAGKDNNGKDYTVESWFARNIGLIKFHVKSGQGDTTWSLAGWHTEQ